MPNTSWLIAKHVLSWSDAFALMALLSLLLSRLRLGAAHPVPTVFGLAGLLYCVAALASYFQSFQHFDLFELSKFLFATLVFPCVVYLSGGIRQYRLYLVCWGLGALLCVSVGVVGSFGYELVWFVDEKAMEGNRVWGNTYHPNSLAYVASLVTPVAVYWMLASQQPIRRYTALAIVMLMLYAIYLSGSRISFLACPFGLGLMLLIGIRQRRVQLNMVAFILLGSVVVALAGLLILPERLVGDDVTALARLVGFTESVQYANEERLRWMEGALADIAEFPLFGAGFSNIRIAHNTYFQVLHAGGVFSLLGFVVWQSWVLWLCYQLTLGRLAACLSRRDSALATALVAAVIISFVSCLTHNLVTDRNGYVAIGILLGLFVQAYRAANKHHLDQHPHGAPIKGESI